MTRNFTYNPLRLQATEISDTITGQPSSLLDLKLFWGSHNSRGSHSDQATNNNGNLWGQFISTGNAPNAASAFTAWESYGYDPLGRILTVTDDGSGSPLERDFGYDRFGNVWHTRNDTGLPEISGMLGQQSQLDANTNRTTPTSQYDTQGNQPQVGSYTMQYDGENRLISAAQSNGAAITYDYDGAGQRVRQTNTDGTATVFVYDALGQMAYQVTSGSQAAPPCTTCYLSWDHLGTTRMVTDQNTNLISFHDYLPFGDELAVGSAGRLSWWGASDGVRQKFTGQEQDSTGLDYFLSRHLNPVTGRFLSPDPGSAGGDILNPQSWHGYAYVLNSPLRFVDPFGLQSTCPPGSVCLNQGNGGTSGSGTGVSYGGSGIGNGGLSIGPSFSFSWSGGNTPTVMLASHPIQTNGVSILWGGLRTVCGAGEAAAGASLGAAISWTGIGAVGGGIVVVHGLDQIQARLGYARHSAAKRSIR